MTAELVGEATIVERGDIQAARRRIAGYVRSTPVLEAGRARSVWRRRSSSSSSCCSTRGRSSRGERSTRCSPPTCHRPASSPPRRELRARGGLRRARARSSRGDLRPDTSPDAKIEGIRSLGADVEIVPGYYHEASVVAAARQAESGALAMHPYDQPEVVAGAGTVGLELADQVPDADTVLVAVGGGGLIAGVASWFRGDVRVVGVEPEACPTLHDALRAGAPVDVDVGGLAADSWDRDASAPSRSPLRAHGSSGSSWCPMRRSATHNAGCGTTPTWSPSREGRRPSRG